eukprot:TRINITY_DN2739_c0_g1_i16.p1 TRINITY_DN2739_c0_g1~~TRINITY_DN2739_c0_g1_i16.p1  ORF type:complete len:314 (-),score=31.09 TRINITY_DN2739_c0_g1_i16:121-1062(-)
MFTTFHKIKERLALLPQNNCIDTAIPRNSNSLPQVTKQHIEDLSQLLEIESSGELQNWPRRKRRVWYRKRGCAGSFGTVVLDVHKGTPAVDIWDGVTCRNNQVQRARVHCKRMFHKQNFSDVFVQQATSLSRNPNLKKLRNTDKQSINLTVLPQISNIYGTVQRLQFRSRNDKGGTGDYSFVDLRLRKVSGAVRKKMRQFDRTFDCINKELQAEDYLENKRRRAVLSINRNNQLKQTEILLRDIVLDEPRFVDNLHDYKQQSITRFLEDRKNMKDRLYNLLANPNRMIAKLERQGLLRKDFLLNRRKAKSILN